MSKCLNLGLNYVVGYGEYFGNVCKVIVYIFDLVWRILGLVFLFILYCVVVLRDYLLLVFGERLGMMYVILILFRERMLMNIF